MYLTESKELTTFFSSTAYNEFEGDRAAIESALGKEARDQIALRLFIITAFHRWWDSDCVSDCNPNELSCAQSSLIYIRSCG